MAKHPQRRSGDLPHELIEFDRKVPLIAEPGSDRRNSVPENIREQAREVIERDRKRELERQREANVRRELEAQRIAAAQSAAELAAARSAEEEERLERDRKRELERQREANVRRELESQRIAAAQSAAELAAARSAETAARPPAQEERKIKLPSGFLGLSNEDESAAEERVAPVVTAPVAAEPPRATPRVADNSYWNLEDTPQVSTGGVSGPSFLGLSDSPDEVEQDEVESHTRRNVALVVLLLLIGLGATQWHQIRDQALPFVKNGTQKVLLKVKGIPGGSTNDNASHASSATPNSGAPDIEVAPTNEGLKKAEPPASPAAAAAPSENAAPTSEPNNSTPASNAAADANSPSSTGGVTGAATKAENAAEDSKPANDVATKTAGAKKSAADDTESSKADEDNTPPAKETAKKSAEPSRKVKTSAAHPKIEEDEPQAGSAELAAANAASDPARQRQLLWEAVKKGNPDASVKLAELYIMGRGVEKSCDQAMVLLRSASVHASSRARGKLGAMYATGECVPQDRVQAYHWMSMALAANPNSDWTERYRESIWNQMTAGEKVLAKKDR